MTISPGHLQIVKNIITQIIPDLQVWVFGSRHHGNSGEFSDLDLAVVSSQPIALELMGKLKRAFSESNLPFTVDVLDFASASPEFQSIIAENHEVL